MLQDRPIEGERHSKRRTPVGLVVETERLTLRRPTQADAAAIAALANDRRVAEMTRRLPHPYLPEHATAFVTALDAVAVGESREKAFLIEHLHRAIGMVGVDWHVRDQPAIGYWLGVDHWGQGFATEAARAAIDLTFEDNAVAHIVASARVVNPASRNVLEKCGFQWTGVELHRVECIGSSTPVDCFRLTRTVWSSLKTWGASTRREG